MSPRAKTVRGREVGGENPLDQFGRRGGEWEMQAKQWGGRNGSEVRDGGGKPKLVEPTLSRSYPFCPPSLHAAEELATPRIDQEPRGRLHVVGI